MTAEIEALVGRFQWLLDTDPESKVFDIRATTLVEVIAALTALQADLAAAVARAEKAEGALQKIAAGNPTIDCPEADAAWSASIARAALAAWEA